MSISNRKESQSMEERKLIPNFGLIMLCSLIAIGVGVIVAIFNDKKKK